VGRKEGEAVGRKAGLLAFADSLFREAKIQGESATGARLAGQIRIFANKAKRFAEAEEL